MTRCLHVVVIAAAMLIDTSCTDPGAPGGGIEGTTGPDDIWMVESEPSVTVGTVDGPPETLLYRATSAVVLSDGTIVIGNAGTNELRFFDAGGEFVRSAGSEGEGPGEFRTLSDVWKIRGDTILAWDLRQRRLSYFTPEGEFIDVRSFVIPPVPMAPGFYLTNSVTFQGVFRDGSIVAVPNGVAAMNLALGGADGRYEGELRLDEPILVLPRDTTIPLSESGLLPPLDVSKTDTIGVFPGTEQYAFRAVIRPGGDVQQSASAVIFGEVFLWAHGPDFVAVGAGKPYLVNLYDAGGVLRGSIRRTVPGIRVTDAMVRDFKADYVAQGSEDFRPIRAENVEKRPVADTLPTYSALHFDQDGNLWVRDFSLPGADDNEPYHYSIYSPDGRWLAQLDVPSDLSVLDRGADYILTRARDEFDVEQIRLYRIVPQAR